MAEVENHVISKTINQFKLRSGDVTRIFTMGFRRYERNVKSRRLGGVWGGGGGLWRKIMVSLH